MSARILHPALPQTTAPAPASVGLPERAPGGQHLGHHPWRGASGRTYGHSVYTLIACPPLPMATYILVQRDQRGRRMPLHVAVGHSDAPTLNLARVRQRGAQLGANEVHVHFGAASDGERRLVACDLRAGLFATLAAEP